MLKPKQKEFVNQYPVDFNATQAAIRAGYSPKSAFVQGSRLLSNDKVQAALAISQAKREEKTGVTAEWVLKSLESVALRCMQEEPVLDKRGNPTGEYQFRDSGANKALELLGKNLKLFTDKLEINITLSESWKKASIEEKQQLLLELRAELGEDPGEIGK